MVIWINGAFGAGKTTVSELLHQKIKFGRIFDPEDIGYIICKAFPEARELDYQDLPMWRKLVAQFIVDASRQFSTTLIIPMTLVVPDYLDEILSEITRNDIPLHHFFLDSSKAELQRRITNQVIIEADAAKDEEVRRWRLAQITRCCEAAQHMPAGTTLLDTDSKSPEQLADLILGHLQ